MLVTLTDFKLQHDKRCFFILSATALNSVAVYIVVAAAIADVLCFFCWLCSVAVLLL